MSPRTRATRAESSGPTTPFARQRRQASGDSSAHTPPLRPLLPPGGISLPASVGGYGASQSAVVVPAPRPSMSFCADRPASAAGASVEQATGAVEAEDGRDDDLAVAPVRGDDDEDGHDSGNTSSSSSGSSGSSTGTGSGYVGRKRRAGGRLEPSRRPQSPGVDNNSRGGLMDAEGSQDNLQEVFGTPPARRVGTAEGSLDRNDATAASALAGVVDVDAEGDGMVADNVAGGVTTPAPVVSSDDDDAEVPVRTLPARSAAAGVSGGAALRLPEAPPVSTMGARRVADEHETTRRLLDLQMTGEQPPTGVDSSSPSGAGSSKRLRPWCNHDRYVWENSFLCSLVWWRHGFGGDLAGCGLSLVIVLDVFSWHCGSQLAACVEFTDGSCFLLAACFFCITSVCFPFSADCAQCRDVRRPQRVPCCTT